MKGEGTAEDMRESGVEGVWHRGCGVGGEAEPP